MQFFNCIFLSFFILSFSYSSDDIPPLSPTLSNEDFSAYSIEELDVLLKEADEIITPTENTEVTTHSSESGSSTHTNTAQGANTNQANVPVNAKRIIHRRDAITAQRYDIPNLNTVHPPRDSNDFTEHDLLLLMGFKYLEDNFYCDPSIE